MDNRIHVRTLIMDTYYVQVIGTHTYTTHGQPHTIVDTYIRIMERVRKSWIRMEQFIDT